MNSYELSFKELELIKMKGLTSDNINEQIEKIKRGIIYIELDRPAKLFDGIKKMSKYEEDLNYSIFEEKRNKLKIIKFVPASGAASRMFLDLLNYYNNENLKTTSYIEEFISGIKKKKFAFVKDLNNCMFENGYNIKNCIKNNEIRIILKYLLKEAGLNYSNLPKAVLKFHLYKDKSNTPIDEQINEGINYARGIDDKIYIHFTISSEFNDYFIEYIELSLNKLNINKEFINISLSVQKESTQTIALNKNNKLFKTVKGNLLFRPGGHGALIENLNELDGDIIFIKNIDNVVVESSSKITNYYKKVLAGYLIKIRNKVFEFSKILEENTLDDKLLIYMLEYCNKTLNIVFSKSYNDLNIKNKIKILKNRLSRPIRVCGMVKNEGEPGGGPFWLIKNGEVSLQIIESASVDKTDKTQTDIFKGADFFNPVDIICSVRNHKGVKYNLVDFIDEEAFFITEKSKDGDLLKALELPGLWNGAMADWITIFIEVPLITFNPVKTVNDLLKQNHQI